jgi:hypothetical protein
MFPLAVIVGLTLLLALKLWLDFCLEIDERHKGDPRQARTLIVATGRSFPLVSRAVTGKPTNSLFGREHVDGRSPQRPGQSE